MGEEVLVGLIDQQRVKIGGQPGGVRQSQLFFDRREDVLQCGVVPLGADEVLRDLPRVADVRVGQRLLATAEPGRPVSRTIVRSSLVQDSTRAQRNPSSGTLYRIISRLADRVAAGAADRAPRRDALSRRYGRADETRKMIGHAPLAHSAKRGRDDAACPCRQ